MKARIPSATYRLQFHGAFTFQDAIAILDYLDNLGITDIYASPYFQASLESTHGYDVADHNTLNPAVGNELEYRRFITELHHRQMGQLLDFVPNHMGISESLNQWWMDVLENGTASAYANYFDIDWHPRKRALSEKVILPILGDRYGKVLEKGELVLECNGGAFFVQYFSTALPINPRTYPIILRRAVPHLEEKHLAQIRAIITQLSSLTPSKAKSRLANLLQQSSAIRRAVELAVNEFRGTPGNPKTFDALHELLEQQAYRLSYWRVAAEEINYRRFFDINNLAALRVEIPEVFEASHQLVFRLLANGAVTGLRIDHVDGLWNPKEYLTRLQNAYSQLTQQPTQAQELYLIVEKILETTYEKIPSDWPVAGTTGYEFASQTTNLLIDSVAAKLLTDIYQHFVGPSHSFSDLVYEKKRLVMETSFQSEIFSLGHQLDDLSELYRNYRDFTLDLFTNAIREVIACFPVYRTYASPDRLPSESEERSVLRAVSLARRHNPTIDKAVFDFLRNLLLMRLPEGLSEEQRKAHVQFVMKFQQCTSPVMAKGLEDTVFYLYNRLIALNEVGGNPGNFGMSPADFHQINIDRYISHPHTLLGTSTHDTKRSEDVRLRIAALSEMPIQWRKACNRWLRINRKFRSSIEGETTPSPNEEYFLYQTLVGCWPLNLTAENRSTFIQRIQEYMVKVLKEGKVNSSWTEPNEEWERAVTQFIANILNPKTGAKFLRALTPFVEEVARLGAWNSLSETILKCTVPGVPDFYQGTEIWDFSLVDPDNRRPVDYSQRKQLLESVKDASPEELISDWKSGRIKLCIIQRLLRFRREHANFFQEAYYQSLVLQGTKADHAVAFLRKRQTDVLCVIVPRLTSKLGPIPIDNVWTDTKLDSPILIGSWKNILTGETHHFESPETSLSKIFNRFPFAVFYQEQTKKTSPSAKCKL